MLISTAIGSVEYALGLIRSAQTRLTVAGLELATGKTGGGNPELLKNLRLAKVEQRLAVRILATQDEMFQDRLDILA